MAPDAFAHLAAGKSRELRAHGRGWRAGRRDGEAGSRRGEAGRRGGAEAGEAGTRGVATRSVGSCAVASGSSVPRSRATSSPADRVFVAAAEQAPAARAARVLGDDVISWT